MYPIHPASLDGCFQTVTPSLWAGERSSMNAVLVPAIIDSLIINKIGTNLKEGLSSAISKYSGRGRSEEAKSYFSSCSVWDSENGSLLMRLSGLRYAKLDTGVKNDSIHTFDRVSWKPDVSFLTQDQLTYLSSEDSASRVDQIVDLVAHKKPALKVLEINLDSTDLSCIWFEGGDASSRAAYLEFTFASPNAKNLISVQTKYESERNTSFNVLNSAKERFALPLSIYDLAILKLANPTDTRMTAIVQNLKPLLSDRSYVIFVKRGLSSPNSESDTSEIIVDTPSPGSKTPNGRSSPNSPNTEYSEPEDFTEENINGLLKLDGGKRQALEDDASTNRGLWNHNKLEGLMAAHSFGSTLTISDGYDFSAYLSTPVAHNKEANSSQILCVARLAIKSPAITSTLRSTLERSGWQITEHTYPFQNIAPRSTILILDELFAPVLTQIKSNQWQALKTLTSLGSNLLWVTKGSQYEVCEPDNALVHGLFRTIRMEDPSAKLNTLDVHSSTSPATALAIDRLLESFKNEKPKTFVETEFAERNGIIYIQRVVPDIPVNKFRSDERDGAEPVLRSLHDAEAVVTLRAERLGTFSGLQYCEVSATEIPVERNKVEIEIIAAGVNFKDVAVSMGIVPENEFTIGYEASGIIKRLGPGVNNFKIGDRVCFLNSGSYANRIQVTVGRVHCIPDSMSFEDAATIPSVYLASVYSLFNMANLRKGQSVLIHSASGGVGLACIQLARYMDADIYVTVGTDEKRKFLADNYGVPYDRMFSSRNTKFAKEILESTNGRGIDVIINSLIGEMLDESWRICADGGTMVEIGKKDIVDRNQLSMEPFDRNCSFRAMDFSYTYDISDTLIASLLSQIFELIKGGHIKPIHPITTFGFNDIPSALVYIRSGRHIGKVVITSGEKPDVQVLIRPAIRGLSLRSDASYLIVGGLKGLCGSLAIHMAKHGAKRIIACSRSGLNDDASKKIILNCLAWGCEIQEAKGDVSDLECMRQVFKQASPPIAGVIQGAMILRDKPYETMTLEDYHTTISGKVQGTWNLHNVTLEQKKPLDFFTMLSSISGIIGNKGQANYSAGNTFLDAFAKYRSSQGLCANAVDLGLIEDVGYIAEHGGMESHFDKRQWTGINEGVLRKILTYSILQQTAPINRASSTQLITGIGFPLQDDSDLIRDARFGYLFAQSASNNAGKASSEANQTIRAFLLLHQSAADRSALVTMAIELISTQFTKILRLESDMEPAKPPMAYGLDSLAAVELRNWVRMELGADLTTLDITNASSLISLCEKLVSKLPETENAT